MCFTQRHNVCQLGAEPKTLDLELDAVTTRSSSSLIDKNTILKSVTVDAYSCSLPLFFSLYSLVCVKPGHKVIKRFSCSAQLRLKFIVLINVKMPIVGILTFISSRVATHFVFQNSLTFP